MLALTWGTWALAAAAWTLCHAVVIVPRLPEPPDGTALGKLPYRELPTPPRVTSLLVVSALAQLITVLRPESERWLWWVFGSAVLTLVWVDLLTTWLPRRLTALVGIELGIGIGIAILRDPAPAALLARAAAGAGGAALIFGLIWVITRAKLGFGDVRLAGLIGAVGGTLSMSGWYVTLLAGALLGAVWGLIARGRWVAPGTTNGFAYGPALFGGPYLACLWLWLG